MRTTLKQRFPRRERGQIMVELALTSMVLLLLLAAVVDFGRALHDYIIIANAAREGARYASHYPWLPTGIRAATIQEAAGSGLSLQNNNITIDPDPGANRQPRDPGVAQPNDPIRVTVTYSYSTMFAALIGVDTLTLRASCQMVVFGCDPPGP